MKRLVTLVAVAVLVLSATCSYAAGPWKGKVIESDTKKPIEGAAVVAVWNSLTRLNPAGSSSTPMKVVETVTNADGEFNFESRHFVYVPMLREVSGPDFLIYKPGYGTYEVATQRGSRKFFAEGMETVGLQKLEKKEDRLKAYHSARSFNLLIREFTPGLNSVIFEEKNYLGL